MTTLRKRLFPILLIEGNRLIKTKKFSNPRYLGDPLNALRIFNEKCADEILIIDKTNSPKPNLEILNRMVNEAFMPLSYIGNINSISDFEDIFSLGIEKVGVNRMLKNNPALVNDAASRWGKSSIFGCIDIVKHSNDYRILFNNKVDTLTCISDYFKRVSEINIGEIIIQNVSQEGTELGLDSKLINEAKKFFSIPLISTGGCSSINHAIDHIKSNNISGVAAGSIFSFFGKKRAVLINYDYK